MPKNKQDPGVKVGRLAFAFAAFVVGSSLAFQPEAFSPAREFVAGYGVPMPLWGSVFLISGVLIVLAAVQDRSILFRRVMHGVAVLWYLWAIAYIVPVFVSWPIVSWVPAGLFAFVGFMHQYAAFLAIQRDEKVGLYRD